MFGADPNTFDVNNVAPYQKLPNATPAERQAIVDMMTTLANTPLLFLWGKQSYLREKGAETKNLNTLKFLEVILTDTTNPDSDQNLRHCLQEIRMSGLKWKGFVKGQSAVMGLAGRWIEWRTPKN